MDRLGPPNRPRYQLTRGFIGLDNEKDAMTSRCLDSKEVRGAIWRVHSGHHLAGRSAPTGLAIVHWIGY